MNFSEMLVAVQRLHIQHNFRSSGGEDPLLRIALLAEEVGELAAAVTKDQGDQAEECADILISLLGTCVSLNIDIDQAFWKKMSELQSRPVVTKFGHSRLAKRSGDDKFGERGK